MAGADLVDGGLLEHVERHVDEFHILRFGDIGGVADAVAFVKRTGFHRHVAQRHQIIDVHRHVFPVEFHRRDAGLTDLPALVLAGLWIVGLAFVGFLVVFLVIVAHAGQEVGGSPSEMAHMRYTVDMSSSLTDRNSSIEAPAAWRSRKSAAN